MDTTSRHSELLDRLTNIRHRARRMLLLHGIASVVLFALAVGLGLMVLDWLLWFPGVVRLVFLLGWFGWVGVGVYRLLIQPLRAEMNLIHIAQKIESRFSTLNDSLSSAISFVTSGSADQDTLQQKLVELTEVTAQSIPFEDALSPKLTHRMLRFASVGVGIVLLCSLFQPTADWTATGVQRLFLPFSATAWPKSVVIEPLTEDMTLAMGESAVVSMRVVKGQRDSLRAYLHTRSDDGKTEKFAMRREGESHYAWTLNGLTQNIEYWFEAKDDNTRNRSNFIRVVSRPAVMDLRLWTQPPTYVSDQRLFELPSGQHNVSLIEGSKLLIQFRSSKSPARDAQDHPRVWMTTTDDSVLPIQFDESEADPDIFRTEIVPDRNQVYTIRMVDNDNFENNLDTLINVSLTPDAPPFATITKPVESLEVTPEAAIQICGVARDDLGIDRLQLTGLIRPAAPFTRTIADWKSQQESGGKFLAQIVYEWSLQNLAIKPGQVVEYALTVYDNRRTETLEPQSGRSATLVLRVVSPAQLTAAVADELIRLAKKLRESLDRQEQLMDRTAAAELSIPQSTRSAVDANLLQLSSSQRSVADGVLQTIRQLDELSERLRRNNVETSREKQQIDLLESKLKNDVQPPMQTAADRLNTTRAATSPSDQQTEIRAVRQQQLAAAEVLRQLLEQMRLWDDYQSVVVNLQDLTDLQQQIAQQTARIQEETLGQDQQSLTDELRQRLQQNAGEQQRLTQAIEQALNKMAELQNKLRTDHPDDAHALAETRQLLQKNPIDQLSRRASESIRQNKTGEAQTDQNQIERTLTEAVTNLENKQTRQLEELSKELAKVEEIIRFLLDQQKQLREQTAAVSPDQAEQKLPDLAGRQRKLRDNTKQMADRFIAAPQTAEVGRHLSNADPHMATATDRLYDRSAETAIAAQDRAITELEAALSSLKSLLDQAEQAIAKQKLFAVKRALIALRRKQDSVNVETTSLIEKVAATGKASRREIRLAKKQAEIQNGILGELAPIEEKLTAATVYLWVLQRIRETMTLSHDRLAEAQLDADLQQVQQRSIALLDQLIDAIKQAEAFADEQFAEGAGGGSGGGTGQTDQPQNPVPTVAELIVLKNMQQDILHRTQELARRMDPNQPTEAQLQQSRQLGAEQQQLKELTIELTIKAQQNQ